MLRSNLARAYLRAAPLMKTATGLTTTTTSAPAPHRVQMWITMAARMLKLMAMASAIRVQQVEALRAVLVSTTARTRLTPTKRTSIATV